uniref:Energy-coupling factor transporter transmembrane protein EcfT n=1 Tax=Ignisphaera aggregans TaxID=334771 RepID=A0A7C2V8R1_9CREN
MSKFIITILRSLFLYGFSYLRKGSTVLSITHIFMVFLYGLCSLEALVLYTLPTILIYSISRMHILLLYSFTISSIPGLWMSLSQLILDTAKGFADPLKYIMIYSRVVLVSLNVMFLLHTVNPTEISFLLSKIKRVSGVYPYIFIRIMSFLIKESAEIIYSHHLKKEKAWKTLAILFIRGDELAKGFSEGLIPKYHRFKPVLIYSLRSLLQQLLLFTYDLAILLLLY